MKRESLYWRCEFNAREVHGPQQVLDLKTMKRCYLMHTEDASSLSEEVMNERFIVFPRGYGSRVAP